MVDEKMEIMRNFSQKKKELSIDFFEEDFLCSNWQNCLNLSFEELSIKEREISENQFH